MRRRDISKVLFASAAGSLTVTSQTVAQTCTPPCFPRSAGEIAAGVTPLDYGYAPGNIRRYGGCSNGTDDSCAVRQALDVAAADGTTVTCVPSGTIRIRTTVYIPQRAGGLGQKGFLIDLYGSILEGAGQGIGTIFETGTGNRSTNGASNFNQIPESGAALHIGTVIAGARFRACGTALNLFNFVQGCKLQDLWFEDVDRCVTASRSFYLELHNCHAQIQNIAPSATLFEFTGAGANNAITVIGCAASGFSGNRSGTGFRFFGGGAGIVFHGNTAENLDKGLVIASAMSSIDIRQNYFEALGGAGIDASAQGAKTMDVDGNWFYQCGRALSANSWVSGTFSASNVLDGLAVEIDDVNSKCVVEVPVQSFTEATANAGAAKLPANYSLGNGVIFRAPRMVYVEQVGLTQPPIAIDAVSSSSVPDFHYSGGHAANGAGYNVPFVSQNRFNGSSQLDTQIIWSEYRMIVVFDLYTVINGARRLRGLVFAGGAVQRFDNEPLTVTASNNGGLLRLTIAGTAHSGVTADGFLGQIRHM